MAFGTLNDLSFFFVLFLLCYHKNSHTQTLKTKSEKSNNRNNKNNNNRNKKNHSQTQMYTHSSSSSSTKTVAKWQNKLSILNRKQTSTQNHNHSYGHRSQRRNTTAPAKQVENDFSLIPFRWSVRCFLHFFCCCSQLLLFFATILHCTQCTGSVFYSLVRSICSHIAADAHTHKAFSFGLSLRFTLEWPDLQKLSKLATLPF